MINLPSAAGWAAESPWPWLEVLCQRGVCDKPHVHQQKLKIWGILWIKIFAESPALAAVERGWDTLNPSVGQEGCHESLPKLSRLCKEAHPQDWQILLLAALPGCPGQEQTLQSLGFPR